MFRLLLNSFGMIGKFPERERGERRGFGRVLLKRLMIRLLPNSFGMIGKFLEGERERERERGGGVEKGVWKSSLKGRG